MCFGDLSIYWKVYVYKGSWTRCENDKTIFFLGQWNLKGNINRFYHQNGPPYQWGHRENTEKGKTVGNENCETACAAHQVEV